MVLPVPKNRILVLAALCLISRLVFLGVFSGPNYFEGISGSYLHVADNVIAGKGSVTRVNIAPLTEPALMSDEPFIDRPLGYLLLILTPYTVIGEPIAVQVFQVLLSCLGVILLYQVSRQLISDRAAWWAAGAYAVWPLSARFEIAILPDAVMSFFLLLSVWLFQKASRQSTPLLWSLMTGLVSGAAMTMRPDVLFVPLIFVAFIVATRIGERKLHRSVLLLCGVTLILGLHTVRNHQATDGEIVPLGLGNGISLWEGISQFGDIHGTVYGDERMARLEGYQSWAYPNGIERDRRRFREALAIIADNPVWYLGVMLRRIPVLLTPDWIMTNKYAPSLKQHLDESPEHSFGSYLASYPFASFIRGIVILLQYATLVLALVWLRRGWTSGLWLPVLIIAYYFLIHIPTNAEARYFYPAIPFVLLLSAHGWETFQRTRIFHAR